jgi:hypothetical protein
MHDLGELELLTLDATTIRMHTLILACHLPPPANLASVDGQLRLEPSWAIMQ